MALVTNMRYGSESGDRRLCQSVSAMDIFKVGLPSASFQEKSLTGNFSLVIFVKIQLFGPTHNMELAVLCFPRVVNVCAALLGRKVPSLSCWLSVQRTCFQRTSGGAWKTPSVILSFATFNRAVIVKRKSSAFDNFILWCELKIFWVSLFWPAGSGIQKLYQQLAGVILQPFQIQNWGLLSDV